MKDLKIQVEKINGLADEQNACGVFSKRIAAGDENGTLACCILLKDPGPSDFAGTLHKVFEIFTTALEGVEDDIGSTLEQASADARGYIDGSKLNASFVVCYFFKGACFVARSENKVKLWSYMGQKSQEIKIEFGSGLYYSGQIFVLGSEKFFSTFDPDSLFTKETEIDLEEVVDGLATKISSEETQSEIGVVFVKVATTDDTEKKPFEKTQGKPDNTEKKASVNSVVAGNKQVVEDGRDIDEIKKGEGSDGGEEDLGEEKTAVEDKAEEQIVRDKVDEQVFSQSEMVEQARGGKSISGVVGGIASSVFAEIGKLRRGEIGAIFRLRRNIVIIAFVILAILGSSAYFKVKSAQDAGRMGEFTTHVDNAKSHLSEAEAILDLNRDKAREKLTEADKEIELALSIFPKDEGGIELKNKIESRLKETENVASLPFKEVVDVGAGLVSVSKGAKELYGIGADKIFKISKEGRVLDDFESVAGGEKGYIFADNAYVVAGDKIVKIDLKTGENEDVGQVSNWKDLSVFLGNVYVLGGSQILKFIAAENGYGDETSYLENPETFDESSHFAIDGSIWVSKKDRILKYTRGKRDDFAISGLVNQAVNFSSIYTDSDAENIYVVDKLNGALLVIKKDGFYQKAYQDREFKKVNSFIVDEAAGKVYIVSGSKVLEASL